MAVLEQRIEALDRDVLFYLTELTVYQDRERTRGPQHFNLASDDARGSEGDEGEEEEEEEEPEGDD
eukprot:11174073-Lingulodinium_polyedra.AAC.1